MTNNDNARRLLDRAALLSATSNRTLLESLYALGASTKEAQAAVNVALAAAVPLAAVEGPRASDDLDAAASIADDLDAASAAAQAETDQAARDAAGYLAAADEALRAYSQRLDDGYLREDVVRYLDAAQLAGGLGAVDGGDGGPEMRARWQAMTAELALLDEEARDGAQGWSAVG